MRQNWLCQMLHAAFACMDDEAILMAVTLRMGLEVCVQCSIRYLSFSAGAPPRTLLGSHDVTRHSLVGWGGDTHPVAYPLDAYGVSFSAPRYSTHSTEAFLLFLFYKLITQNDGSDINFIFSNPKRHILTQI